MLMWFFLIYSWNYILSKVVILEWVKLMHKALPCFKRRSSSYFSKLMMAMTSV